MSFYGIFVLVSFFILILMIFLSIRKLRQKGISATSGAGKSSNSPFIYLIFGSVLLVWIFEVLKTAFQIQLSFLPDKFTEMLFDSVPLIISGIVIVIFSILFLKITLIGFGESLRFGLDKNNKGKLVTKGIFSVSRNPFFLSLNLYFSGIALIFPNIFFIGFAILTIVSIHLFILKEEKFLHRVYGEEYENYSKKVKRYINISKRN